MPKKGTQHIVPVPKLGNAQQGVVFGWAKKLGTKVAVGDILCHIERGQITDDVRSPVAGVLVERCAAEEESVRAGANLAIIDTGMGDGETDSKTGLPRQGGMAAVELYMKYQNDALIRAAATATMMGYENNDEHSTPQYPMMPGILNSASSGSTSMDLQRLSGLSTTSSMLSTAQIGSGYPKPQISPLHASNATLQRVMEGLAGAQEAAAKKNSGNNWGGSTSGASTSKAASSGEQATSTAPVRDAKSMPTPKPREDLEKLRCHLHKKFTSACKFCKRHLSAKQQAEEEANANRLIKSSGSASELSFNCSPLLKERVVSSSYYKSLFGVDDVDGLLQEIREFATDTLDVYKSSVEPSCFMCCVYRLFTLNVSEEELHRLIDNLECTIARCVGVLYIRYVVPPDQLWERLEEYVLDDEELEDHSGGEVAMPRTFGEYVEELLLKDKYYSTPLPRIPAGVRRKLEEGLAPMSQYRKRTTANRRVFGNLRDVRMQVEVCLSGHWIQGRALEVLRQMPSRLKVRVQLDEGQEVLVHIGKVVMRDQIPGRGYERDRSRSRDRQGGSNSQEPDWSRWRGKTDIELVQELRERSRADAVCSDRKGYARRLPRFESGLAMNREKGREEAKLIEDETFITPGMRRRQEMADEEEWGYEPIKRRTDEDDEKKRKMKEIFEKYGQQRKSDAGVGVHLNDTEGPDTMRLG